MKEVEIKRCPECGRVLSRFAEFSDNGGGLRKGLTRYYCENCRRTFDEKDIVRTITKEILPAKLLEEKIRKEMLGLGISDDKVRNSIERIMNERKLGLPIGGSDE